jgi:hypothetical protein
VEAAMRFIEKVDIYLEEFETENERDWPGPPFTIYSPQNIENYYGKNLMEWTQRIIILKVDCSRVLFKSDIKSMLPFTLYILT